MRTDGLTDFRGLELASVTHQFEGHPLHESMPFGSTVYFQHADPLAHVRQLCVAGCCKCHTGQSVCPRVSRLEAGNDFYCPVWSCQ